MFASGQKAQTAQENLPSHSMGKKTIERFLQDLNAQCDFSEKIRLDTFDGEKSLSLSRGGWCAAKCTQKISMSKQSTEEDWFSH